MDPGKLGADFVFHVMGDLVRALHGHLGVHFDVHIHEVLIAHFADEAFFDTRDIRNGLANFFNLFDDFAIRRAVHEVVQRRAQETGAVPGDYTGCGDRGPIVRSFKAGATKDRDGNADGCGE